MVVLSYRPFGVQPETRASSTLVKMLYGICSKLVMEHVPDD